MAAASLKILIVEHNAARNNGLGETLRRRISPQASLTSSADIAAALETARRGDADLVLVDGQLAHDSARQLSRQIDAAAVADSIIVVSSDHNFEMPQELAKLGVAGPLSPDDLNGDPVLERILAQRRCAAVPEASHDSLLSTALLQMQHGVVICDAAAKIVIVNTRAQDLLRLDPEQCRPGAAMPSIAAFAADPVRALEPARQPLHRAFGGETFPPVHLVHRCERSAADIPVSVSGMPLRDREGNLNGAMLVLHETGNAPPMSHELAHLIQHDSLTGVANREMFLDLLRRAIGRADDSPGMLGLFFLDLDRFKEINDSMGHAIGDRLLAGVGKRLRERLRVGDIVGRLGGDEFAVLLESLASNTDAARIAKKVIQELGQPFELDGRQVHTTPSIGIATHPQCGRTAETLLRAADEAMYKAKKDGRNTYHFYSEQLDGEIRRKADLEEALRGALGRGEFRLVYQPQYALPRHRLVGFEAQLRWRHPIEGEIAPREFIPLLESVGVINAVSEWALACACLELSEWRRLQPDLRLSCRASPRIFQRRNIVDGLARILRNAGLPGDCLEVEIGALLLTSKAFDPVATLRAVRDEGIRIVLRDFGVQPIALDKLAQLPLSKLRLHRRIVAALPGDRSAIAIADTLRHFGDGHGIELIAEGVDEQAQLEWLESRNWHVAQGTLLAAPLPALGASELVKRANGA